MMKYPENDKNKEKKRNNAINFRNYTENLIVYKMQPHCIWIDMYYLLTQN